MQNPLYYGDNLAVLRNEIASDGVDLIYLDRRSIRKLPTMCAVPLSR